MTTKSDRRPAVAIIGGGASGTILAAQLARRGIKSALIDGSGRMGRGVAYSTTESAHLLNVCAEGMSAWAGDPDHFARRFGSEGGEGDGYAPRSLFGRYLGEILDEAVASGWTELVQASAIGASRSGDCWRIALADGSYLEAKALALAVGNQEPESLRAFEHVDTRFIGNPWGEEARAAVAELAAAGGAALLVGTGLTAIDLILSLDAAGHRGKVVALSRRGLLPRAHTDNEAASVDKAEIPTRLNDLVAWLRRRSAQVGWRAAIDSLRPHSHAVWSGLSSGQQRRFLRHARPWWDVHRHRIAPQVAETVVRAIGEGRLEVLAGRIIAARSVKEAVEVDFRRRGAVQQQSANFAYVFNCTGPLHSIGRTRDPLLRSLLDSGKVAPDHLGIGLAVGADNRAGDHLWALGPLTKGRYWEIIAVPDIRDQAAAVAQDIKQELGDDRTWRSS